MSKEGPFYPETNALLSQRESLISLVSSDKISDLLTELNYDWQSNSLNEQSQLGLALKEHGFLSNGNPTRQGQLFLSRLLLHFDSDRPSDAAFGSLNVRYKDFNVISSGKNSIVVLVKHNLLDTTFVLKLIRPGASNDITDSVRKLARLSPSNTLVLPIDLLTVSIRDALGHPVSLSCVVFPYVEGKPFGDFLKQKNHHLNSQVAMAFAGQIAKALRELELIGAYHGDLHEGNILVDQYSPQGIQFRIIDISYDAMGSLSFKACRETDMENFRQHVWRLLTAQRASIPNISIRKYVGTKNFIKIEKILSPDAANFADICSALGSDADYALYAKERAAFVSERFSPPTSFRLQRYEEITDPTIAVRLFVPYDPLMNKVREFSNIYVSGNRGSGKSTYLAALAFFPETADSPVDFRETFGIYFPCRQGEFRPLTTRVGREAEAEQNLVTGVMIFKIIRRTLETLASGVNAGRLSEPPSATALRSFVEKFVPSPGLVSVEHDLQTELDNLVATMIRVEMDAVTGLALPASAGAAPPHARQLIEFFEVVRQTFSELSASRFHLLFDDAGEPYVPNSVQKIINDLMITSNPLFCVKLSAEKLTFQFQSSDGKILEAGQDYFEHDISHILFIGSGSTGLNRAVLERYFRQIVEQRLQYFRYDSSNITDYVGDEQIPIDRLLSLLAAARKDAYYCGWTTIWNIADRTPRNLLEIVSEIFSVGNIERETPAVLVPPRDQDRAIRTISEKRLESLSQISGSVRVAGKEVSLGRQLFETTAAIGSTFRRYLRRGSRRDHRPPRQHLAVERNDLGELSVEADIVLRRLITFGVLDSAKSAYARDDEVKKPFYVLNRIYCPAFGIGYRRDDHLRLSRVKLEQLLLDPQRFIREGTSRLREAAHSGNADLFGYKDL